MHSWARMLCGSPLARHGVLMGRTFGSRSLAIQMNRERRRNNGGVAEWWSERTYRFGRGIDSDQPHAILSFEIVTTFDMNQYLLGCPDTGVAAIIDTGDATASLETAKSFGLEVKQLLQTHAHIDHIQGLADIKEMSDMKGVPIYLHPADLVCYRAAEMQAKMFGIPLRQPPEPDVFMEDGQKIFVGQIPLDVIHTPGHSPGHVSFYCKPHGFLIAGDLLFAGSIGRTDFPHSDRIAMTKSLTRILELPDDTKLSPRARWFGTVEAYTHCMKAKLLVP